MKNTKKEQHKAINSPQYLFFKVKQPPKWLFFTFLDSLTLFYCLFTLKKRTLSTLLIKKCCFLYHFYTKNALKNSLYITFKNPPYTHFFI